MVKKVALVKMQMLRIGNQAGFTLLEMLAVITLLGIIAALIWPNFILSGEKTELQYIERLIKVDLEQVRNEAIAAATGVSVNFRADGYDFVLGKSLLERNFKSYQFQFEISDEIKSPELKPDTNLLIAEKTEIEKKEAVKTEDVKAQGSLLINKEGELSEEYRLQWQTTHFQGALIVQTDGKVKWEYARKK